MALRKLAVWTEKAYSHDELFNPESPLNRDNCLSAFHLLKKNLEAQNWECHTQELYLERGTDFDAVLFLDMPKVSLNSILGNRKDKVKKFVVLFECEVVRPDNWELAKHREFDAIFTWADQFVDNKKYFKINFPNSFPKNPEFDNSQRTKLCVAISANKKSGHPLELYSAREQTIRWFEKNQPGDFDLYGIGWDSYRFDGPKIIRALNKLTPLTRLLAPHYPSYKGKVASKRPVMAQYKFAICYENAKDIPGYITEKIFDCFLAGTIPVYLGAPDIAKHVPPECFIDGRSFNTTKQLYEYLTKMPETDYLKMQKKVMEFLISEKAKPFSNEYFAAVLSRLLEAK